MKLKKSQIQIWKDSDGWWAILPEGWVIDGCSGVRENTKRRLMNRLQDAKQGKNY